MKTKDELIDDLLSLAFAEDIGDGDHTTLSTIGPDAMGKQHLLIKEEGIIAGVDIARKVFAKFDPTLKMTVFIEDGTHVRRATSHSLSKAPSARCCRPNA